MGVPDDLVPVRCPYCGEFLAEVTRGATVRRKCRGCKAVRTVVAFPDQRWHGRKPVE